MVYQCSLQDTRRMNVALTRARSSLFILGNASTLERSNATWGSIVQDARERSALLDVSEWSCSSQTSGLTSPQVDESYFSTIDVSSPKQGSPKRPAQSRQLKKASPAQPPPTNLQTPRQLKASKSLTSPSRTRQPLDSSNPTAPVNEAPSNTQASIPVKRGLANVEGEGSSNHSSSGPPPKKPKKTNKAPQLFIPKPVKVSLIILSY